MEVDDSPAVANGVVYIGTELGDFYAIDAPSATPLWDFDLEFEDEFRYSAPAVANVVVYVGANSGTLYAVDASNGKELWSYSNGGGASSPAVVNGIVYEGSAKTNTIYAFGLP